MRAAAPLLLIMRPGRHMCDRPGRRAAAAWAALLTVLLPTAQVVAQQPALEVAVKATFLVKFAAFVEWPASAFATTSSPLNLCVLGTALGGVADQAATGQMAGQHPVVVRHIATAAHASGCQVLFAAGSSQQSVEEALDAVRGEPVLTVTDLPPAAPHRGIINFVLQSNHVRFEINDGDATQEGLRISSQLLSLAVNTSMR